MSRAKKSSKMAFDAERRLENAAYARRLENAAYARGREVEHLAQKKPPDGKSHARPVEVYGPHYAPRVKWTCVGFVQRNDHAIAVQEGSFVVMLACCRCERVSRLSLTRKTTEAA